MSERVYIQCDFGDCKTSIDYAIERFRQAEETVGWLFLSQPDRHNEHIHICPEHAKVLRKT